MSEQRFNELRGEEVVYAIHRQDRTFLPSEDHCPLCPTPADPERPAPWRRRSPSRPSRSPSSTTCSPPFGRRREQPRWSCTPTATTAPSARWRPSAREALMWVWRHRYQELGGPTGRAVRAHLREPRGRGRRDPAPSTRPDLRLPVPAAGAEARARGRRAPGGLCGLRAAAPRAGGRASGRARERERRRLRPLCRTLAVRGARRHARASPEPARLRARASCACSPSACRALIRGYDALFARPFPYVMVVHQAPTDGRAQGHLHVEFYPPLRTAEQAQVPRRLRAGRGHVHRGHAARGFRRGAARGDRPCRAERVSARSPPVA